VGQRDRVRCPTLVLVGEQDDPFLGVSRVAVEVREADAIRRTLSVASVAIDGLDLKVRRDGNGVIDVVELFTQKAPAAGALRRSAAFWPST